MKNVRLFVKILISTLMILISSTYILPIISFGATVTQEVKAGIESFPKEYQDKLLKLKKLHPNWNFEAYYTGIDWNELIKNETGVVLHKRNVVPSYYSDLWKCSECESVNGWTCASEKIVKYFIDPRNFLNEVNIFQFEELSFNKSVHTLEGIQASIKNTFLENSVTYFDDEKQENVTRTYSEIILEVAEKTNISPFHIKAKIIQEVGSQGSASVSGTYPGYENYYNFFNYGAYDDGDPIANGLAFAKKEGWNTPYKAILGGAKLIGTSYIEVGQNTSYFFKFDVVGDRILKSGDGATTINDTSFYRHQYMTNVMDPYSQSSSVYNTYAQNGNLDASLNFIIPVYENMGESLNKKPTKYTTNDGDLYYTNVIKTAGVRDNPKIDSPIVYYLQKDEMIVMINRKCVLSDGVYWDIVMLENGWNVYVQSDCMELYAEMKEESNDIEVQIYDERKMIKAIPTAEINGILNKLQTTNYSIEDNTGNVLVKEKEAIATGYKLNILKSDNKTIEKTYTLIKVGDVNGDGNITASDYVLIKNYIMENKVLTEAGKNGADVNNDTKITSGDYVKIKNYIMENKPIYLTNN